MGLSSIPGHTVYLSHHLPFFLFLFISFFFFAMPQGFWDLNSLIKNLSWALDSENIES